jgi:UDP-N-acetyl-D-glucosamine dehydrogenase
VLMDMLHRRGARVAYHDPHVPVIKPTREHAHWAGNPSAPWSKAAIEAYDAVVIATNHAAVNYRELAEWSRCIIDTRNAMAGLPLRPGQLYQA